MGIDSGGISLLFKAKGDTADAKKAFNELHASVSSDVKKMDGLFGTLLKSDLISNAIQSLTGQITQGISAVFDYSARLEQTKIGFTTLMGGADEATKHLAELQEFAQATPFAFEDLTKASRRLQNVGIEAARVIPVMRDVGNAASAAGASSEELDSITLALSQIIAKGKLSAEEVNQLAERGIPVWRMLSETMGKSKADLIKMAEQGKISADEFLAAFQKFSQANFGDAMEKQSHTFTGALSSIKDATLKASSDAFAPLFKAISGISDRIARSLSEQQKNPKLKREGVSFGMALGEAIGEGVEQGIRNAKTKQGATQPGWWAGLPGGGMSDLSRRLAVGMLKGYQTSANTADANTGTINYARPDYDKIRKQEEARAKLEADARRAAREEAFKKDLPNRQRLASLRVKAERDEFVADQKYLDDQFLAGQKSQDEYRDLSLQRIELYQKQVQDLLANAKVIDTSGKTGTELAALNEEYRQAFAAVEREIADEKKDVEKNIVDGQKKTNDELEKEERERIDKARDRYEEDAASFESAQRVKLAEALRIGSLLNISDEHVAKRTEQIDLETLEKRKQLLAIYIGELVQGTDAYRKAQHEMKILEDQIEETRKKNATNENERKKQAIEDQKRLNQEYREYIDHLEKANQRPSTLKKREPQDNTRSVHDLLGQSSIESLDKTGNKVYSLGNAFKHLKDMAIDSFKSMAQGLGSMVEQWVLYGSAGPDALRKMTASVLASLAAQAAVESLMELARGFAALANPFLAWTAPLHFKSAAIFGAVALTAAVTGRAIAGNAFKKESSGAFGTAPASSGSQRSGSGVYSSQSDTVVENGRNTPGIFGEVVIKIQTTKDHIVDVVTQSMRGAGGLRTEVQDAAAG